MVKRDKTKIKLEDLLRSHKDGLTISDIMKKTKLFAIPVIGAMSTLFTITASADSFLPENIKKLFLRSSTE